MTKIERLYQEEFDEAVKNAVEKGVAKGKENKAIEVALKMINKGNTIDEIIELTDLSLEKIEELKKGKC